jgi:hypothetical protein
MHHRLNFASGPGPPFQIVYSQESDHHDASEIEGEQPELEEDANAKALKYFDLFTIPKVLK